MEERPLLKSGNSLVFKNHLRIVGRSLLTFFQSAKLLQSLKPIWLLISLKENIGYHGTFQPKWQITCVAEDRHLKYMKALNEWDGVSPFGETMVVPHLPKEATDQSRYGRRHNDMPISTSDIGEDMTLSEKGRKGDDDHER